MDQLRFNPFHQIHQGLRALLYEASIAVQHTNFTNAYRVGITLGLVEEMIELFESHAHTEDNLVFPMVAAFAPDVVDAFEAQHLRDHELSRELTECIALCRTAPSDTGKRLAGQQLQRALGEFTAFNLSHMNQEESMALELMRQHYTDEELYAKEAEIVASLSQEHKERSARWMLKGLAEHEIVAWYRRLKTNAPSFTFESYLKLAKNVLDEEKFRRVTEELVLAG
ncbi:MAG: hemerythrin domain-containing protein [Chitinophagaceae bacterium]|nr:hemerythrin domain-containing protein [Chitinophagaceae bacterium]